MLAVLWGVLTGLLDEFSPRRLIYVTRLSPVGPEANVWTQALSEIYRTKENLSRLPGKMQVPWLRIEVASATVVGRLRHSSRSINKDAAFEIFLSPGFRLVDGTAISNVGDLRSEGIYMRVRIEQIVEIFSAAEGWTPE
jgi:hypothetical protein